MNKIIPIVAIVVTVGIIAVVALNSTPSINYASMSCDELRDEVFYASSYLPTTNSEVKEQLENLRTILKIQEEKNCENMIIDGKKIVDESIKSALTFGKEPTQETTTQESIYESMSYTKNGVRTHMNNSVTQDPLHEIGYVTINSDSYTVGDVIEITIIFDRDLHAEFGAWSPGQDPDREYVRIDVQHEVGDLTDNKHRYGNYLYLSHCDWTKNYNEYEPNNELISRDTPCIANEDGSFSYAITLTDDVLGGNYRIAGEHGLNNFKSSFSGPRIDDAVRHTVYSHPFEVVPRQ